MMVFRIKYLLRFTNCGFDSINLIGNGFLIPAGPLREKLKSLLKYDCVLIKDSNGDIKNITKAVKINNKVKIFITNFRIKNLSEFKTSKKYLIFSELEIQRL